MGKPIRPGFTHRQLMLLILSLSCFYAAFIAAGIAAADYWRW